MTDVAHAAARAGREIATQAAASASDFITGIAGTVAVAAGAVDIVARLLRGDGSDAPVTPDEYLLAVLAIGTYAAPRAHGIVMELTIAKHVELFDTFEKLTGRKPDSFANPGLAHIVRAVESDAADNLVRFIAERAKHQPN